MPAQTTITGNVEMVKDADGVDLLIVSTSPFQQFVVPLPDYNPPQVPEGAPTARSIVKDALNSGVVTASAADILRK